jgi:hypothetical protein
VSTKEKIEPDKTDENYDQLWKRRTIFNNPSDVHSKYSSPTEHLAVSEIILLFNGIYLQTVYSKGTQMVWDKSYKQCDSKTCNR